MTTPKDTKLFAARNRRKLSDGRCFAAGLLAAALLVSSCGPKPKESAAAPTNSISVPDGSVLQNPKDMRVYYVFGGKRHYVQNPPTLAALGFSNQVKVTSDSEIKAIPLGGQLPLLTSHVIIKSGTGQVFLIEAGKRRYVPDPETLETLHVTKEQIQYLSDAAADAIPLGSPLPHQGRKISGRAGQH